MSSRAWPILLVSICASFPGCGKGHDDPPPGSLDPAFGIQGVVTTPMGPGNDEAMALAIQPDGKIVVVGQSNAGGFQDMAVARYTPRGSLDTTFGSLGKVTLDFDGAHDIARSVAIQPDGKILVAGEAAVGGVVHAAIVRFTTTGVLDATFDGDGKLIGAAAGVATSIALQADGKIVTAGFFDTGTHYDFAAWRYNPDGSPDATFDSDGQATMAVGSAESTGLSMAIQPTGEIVVGGRSWNGSDYDIAVVRFNSDGSPDMGFGAGGFQVTDISGNNEGCQSLALQPDGKIIVAGATSTPSGLAFAAARYGSDGVLDPAFGVGGIVTTSLGPFGAAAQGVATLVGGKMILVGYAENAFDQDPSLARYNADGSLDMDFDGDGRVTTAVGVGNGWFSAVAIDAEGRLVAVGTLIKEYNDDFLMARYLN